MDRPLTVMVSRSQQWLKEDLLGQMVVLIGGRINPLGLIGADWLKHRGAAQGKMPDAL